MSGERSLGDQARSGARWSAAAYYANTFVRLAISIGLARLLAPEDFGVMALAMAVVGFVSLVQDSGLSSALVQHRDPVSPAASTAIVLTSVGGLILAAVAWIAAPLAADLLEQPKVVPLLRALGIVFAIRGVTNPQRAMLQRSMGFRALAAVELGSTAMYGVTAVVLAAGGLGVWSLVVGQILSEAVKTGVVWWSSPWRPSLAEFDWRLARELSLFGRHMVLANLLGILHRELPTLLVGKVLGAHVLGFYWMSLRWASLPIQGVTFVAGRVAYPVFARLRNDPVRFAEGYQRVLQVIVMVAMPAAFGLALIAEPLLGALYDPRWQGAVTPLRILAFFGLFHAVGASTGEVFKASGVPRYVTIYAVLYNVLLGGFLWIGSRWGLEGIALAAVLAPLGVALASITTACRLLGIPRRAVLGLLVTPIQGTIVMVVVVMGVARLLEGLGAGPWLHLVLEAVSGVLAYGAVVYRVDPAWCHEIATTIGLPAVGARRRPPRVETDAA